MSSKKKSSLFNNPSSRDRLQEFMTQLLPDGNGDSLAARDEVNARGKLSVVYNEGLGHWEVIGGQTGWVFDTSKFRSHMVEKRDELSALYGLPVE